MIIDDLYWLEANLRLKMGEVQTSLSLLQRLEKEFPNEILADDAFFLQADIFENRLREPQKAMELYREFLNRYPGSVFAAEARRRFRLLRGDFVEENPKVN